MSSPEIDKNVVRPCCVVLEPLTPKVNATFSAELKNAINERNLLTTKTRKRVTEALEEIYSETEESTRKTKKQNILKEIVVSEASYVRQLEVILQFFVKPVEEKQLLSARDFDILFGSIETIYKINKELLKELERDQCNVGTAFSNIAPLFKCYSLYASGFKRSLDILQNCHHDNPKFAKFLEMQETRPEVQSKLSALLITPIQRVPRYKLLLKPLFNLTSPSEDNYDKLLDSLIKVEDAAEHINKIIREQENMQRLIELQRCLQNSSPNVIVPGRNLIKEGTIMRISPKDGHSQKLYVVLMNDIILFCKIKKEELKVNSLKCRSIFPLSKCRVQEVLDKGAFKLICQDEEIVLYQDSFCDTVKWIDQIKLAIQTLVDDRKTLRKESTVRRPVKRKDLGEYNEVGLSPGKKMRKRKNSNGIVNTTDISKSTVTCRRPLRSGPVALSEDFGTSSSFLVTLKPTQDGENQDHESGQSSHPIQELSKDVDVFVFGKPQSDRGFSFKMNQLLCGIGSSVKKIFGFK